MLEQKVSVIQTRKQAEGIAMTTIPQNYVRNSRKPKYQWK